MHRVPYRPHRLVASSGSNASVGSFEQRHLNRFAANLLRRMGSLHPGDVPKAVLGCCTYNYVERLQRLAETYAKQHRVKIDQYESYKEAGAANQVDTACLLFRVTRLHGFFYRSLVDHFASMQRASKPCIRPGMVERKFTDLASTFGLAETDSELLVLAYLYQNNSHVEQLCDAYAAVCGSRGNGLNPLHSRKVVAALTGRRASEVAVALSDQGKLLPCGILDNDLDIAPEITRFLSGRSSRPIAGNYFEQYTGKALALGEHVVDKGHVATMLGLIASRKPDQSLNILLYGAPGTGKTEFARSVGRHAGLNVYEIRNQDIARESKGDLNDFRQRALLACRNRVDPAKSMIVVDEADSMVNSTPAFLSFSPLAEKGQVNRLLDDNTALTIWITNRHCGIDESTCRRFDYSLEFEKLSFEQRRAVWLAGMRKHRVARLLSEDDVGQLASQYEVSAGGVDVALRNAARVARNKGQAGPVRPLIESLLKAHQKIVDQDRTPVDDKRSMGRNYSLAGLNIRADVGAVMRTLTSFSAYWQTMGEEPEVRNMNVLLYGPPGSGKTEFARHVARTLKRRLVLKRASDLLDMYVGNSEKFIRQAFREAERDKAILFIDETDSLLGSREGAQHSWEITQVNELLTNMEHFRGMFIAATNYRKVVDSAAMRRFNLKLEFDFLTAEGSRVFYERFFTDFAMAPLGPEQTTELALIPQLAPGDFKAVYQRHSFMPRAEITHAMLLEALRQEVQARDDKAGRGMGFAR